MFEKYSFWHKNFTPKIFSEFVSPVQFFWVFCGFDKNTVWKLFQIRIFNNPFHASDWFFSMPPENINFMPMVSFFTPWKHKENLGFYDVFKGYRKRTVTWNGLWSNTTNIYLSIVDYNRNTRKGVKYVHSYQWKHQKGVTAFWYFYWKLWTYFSPSCSVSIVNFEQVNVS